MTRRPPHRETELSRAGAPAMVILVPDEAEYHALGKQLAAAVEARTGLPSAVEGAATYVSTRPRSVKPERLDRHYILLGQFWNNTVLERLYACYFDPTDALFPGPGGWELRTVCSPFRHGHNCVVVTGSDLAGCRKAAAELPGRIEGSGHQSRIPFLHQVHLTGEAAQEEDEYRRRMAPALAELDRYAVFGHPQGKVWTGENPSDFLVWEDRNLASAAAFGLRFWTTGDRQDAEAFKRLVLGCRLRLDLLARSYREGRSDLMDYSGGALTVAWSLIHQTDAFTESERGEITDYLFQLALLNRNAYYIYKCKDLRLEDIGLQNRHVIAGTFWLGLEADFLDRNCILSDEQQRLAAEWRADALRYRQRMAQTPFYSDGTQLIHDEGGLVLRYSLMTGNLDLAENGSLRTLADYFVANNDNLGQMTSSGHNGWMRLSSIGGDVLNVAGWLFPGEGYRWFRGRLGRWPYRPFLFYGAGYGVGFSYFNYEMPLGDDGAIKLKQRMDGVKVLPIGEAFDVYLRGHPYIAQGGYQRVPGRYHYDPVPYAQSWKRIALRSGFEPADQYLAMDGMQGLEWSYDDINAIVRYDDLGQTLLKSQWDARAVESRLEMNTLLVSNGTPGAKQSVAAQLATTADLGTEALLGSRAVHHDGTAWTRNLFWRKNAWFLVADEVRPETSGDHFLAQTWLSWYPFTTQGVEATARAGDVTLHVVGTPERRFALAQGSAGAEGVRQQTTVRLAKDAPSVLRTLLYATASQRPAHWNMHRVANNAVLLSTAGAGATQTQSVLAFLGRIEQGGLRVAAERGLISPHRITLADCRELTVNGQTLLSSQPGVTFAWDLAANRFEAGKRGFGLTPGAHPEGLGKRHSDVARAVQTCLAAAAACPELSPPAASTGIASTAGRAPLPVAARYQLRTPVSLACVDVKGDGNEELLLYDARGKARFAYPSFQVDPVAVRFDRRSPPDVAFALDNAVAVYHWDGTLRWRQDVGGAVGALSAGDLDGDGREELGVTLYNYALVLNHAGRRLIEEDAYRYTGLAGAVGDVDGDGRKEFVAVNGTGVNVLRPGQHRRTVMAQSYLGGTSPCRVWLRDLDGDGAPKCYLGGGGVDPACYDLKTKQMRWTFAGASVHPRDAAMWDADGDGRLEMVSGSEDGFLYVVDCRDGKFRYSRSVGAAIHVLALVPGPAGAEGDLLAVGLETGQVLLLGRRLKTVGWAEMGEPVKHLASLRRPGGRLTILAAGSDGTAIRVELADSQLDAPWRPGETSGAARNRKR